jgi:hypothetical protein
MYTGAPSDQGRGTTARPENQASQASGSTGEHVKRADDQHDRQAYQSEVEPVHDHDLMQESRSESLSRQGGREQEEKPAGDGR